MNIRFKNIDIEGFRSIQKAIVNLQDQGTVIVKGINEYEDKATSNGSGKSSVFEAIVFTLFEETSSGEKDVANRILNNGYTIKLEFDIDIDNYVIQRQCKNNKTSVVLYKNGTDISARNKTDTNKLILSILGINKSIFLDSIFLSQCATTNLASLSPTARKERLEILTNTDYMIASFKDKLKEKQIKYEAKCVDNQMSVNKLKGNIEVLITQKQEAQLKLEQIKQEIEQYKDLGDIAQVEAEIKQLQDKLVEIDNSVLDIDNQKGQYENNAKEIKDNISLIEPEYKKLEDDKQIKLQEWNSVDKDITQNNLQIHNHQANITRLQAEIQKIKVSDKCPTCGRKYDNSNDLHIEETINSKQEEIKTEEASINSIQDIVNELTIKKTEIEAQGKEITDNINIYVDKINDLQSQLQLNESTQKTLEYNKSNLYKEKDKINNNITELNTRKEEILKKPNYDLTEYEAVITKLDEQVTDIEKQITDLEADYITNNNYVETIKHSIQLVTKEFRTYLLRNSIQYLNTLLLSYSKALFSNECDNISIEENDTKLDISLGNATYESLSGGERTRVNIALLLAQKSLANVIGNISCNIIILDEILGYCDSQAETNVIDLLTKELDALESIYMVSHKEIPIGYDTELTIIKDKSGLSKVYQY